MRNPMLRLLAVATLLIAVACTKPEPPDKEQPVEPQAGVETDAGDAAEATELRDAIREPIERAEAVEDVVLEAANKQQDAIDAATGG